MSIYNAAMKYRETDTPLVVIAGKEYGTGSSGIGLPREPPY